MRLPLAGSFRALLRPASAFREAPPTLGRAVRDMALIWVPLALVNAGWTAWRALQAYGRLRAGEPPSWLAGWLGADPGDLVVAWRSLPPAPSFGRLAPWLLGLVPLGVLGTWLHHAVWDHTGLWLLGGLKQRRGFRMSLLAEAEALRIAAVGTLLGLLGLLPYLGVVLALPLLLLDAYLWLFRGFALAARHGCESWRGLAATVVHAALLGLCALGLLAWMGFMLRMAA
ncbi:MAG: hypothetical protein H6P99_1336 [Holophagaceae bacterium]|nr:hypothetical protein [Holophagaceae bacterium]